MRACGGWCATGGGNVNANCGHTERVCLLVVVRWLEVGVLSCVGPGANMGIHAPLAAWMRAMQGAFSGSAYAVRPVCTRRAGRKASRAEGQAEVRLTPGRGGVTARCSSLRIHTLLLRIHALVAFCYSLLSPVLPARGENQRHWVRARMVSVYLNSRISGIPGYAHGPTDSFPDPRLRIREFPDNPTHC